MNNLEEIVLSEFCQTDDAEIIIVAYGAVSRSARRAVKEARAEGIKAGLFRPITIWPFPEKEIASLSRQARAIIVPEMNMGQYRLEVERAAQGNTRVSGVNKVTGELITPSEILAAIKSL